MNNKIIFILLLITIILNIYIQKNKYYETLQDYGDKDLSGVIMNAPIAYDKTTNNIKYPTQGCKNYSPEYEYIDCSNNEIYGQYGVDSSMGTYEDSNYEKYNSNYFNKETNKINYSQDKINKDLQYFNNSSNIILDNCFNFLSNDNREDYDKYSVKEIKYNVDEYINYLKFVYKSGNESEHIFYVNSDNTTDYRNIEGFQIKKKFNFGRKKKFNFGIIKKPFRNVLHNFNKMATPSKNNIETVSNDDQDTFVIGENIDFLSFNNNWTPGKIFYVNNNNTYSINYPDGTIYSRNVLSSNIRKITNNEKTFTIDDDSFSTSRNEYIKSIVIKYSGNIISSIRIIKNNNNFLYIAGYKTLPPSDNIINIIAPKNNSIYDLSFNDYGIITKAYISGITSDNLRNFNIDEDGGVDYNTFFTDISNNKEIIDIDYDGDNKYTVLNLQNNLNKSIVPLDIKYFNNTTKILTGTRI